MNHSDLNRNAYMLCGGLAKRGYLRWWHSFSGTSQSTGQSRIFYIEYSIINPTPGKPVRGQGRVLSCVSINAGSFPSSEAEGVRLASSFPVNAAHFAKKPLYFEVNGNVMTEQRIHGEIGGTPDNSMEWNLEVFKSIACHTGFTASPLACALNLLDSFWHAEGIRTDYRGTVILNGEVFDVRPGECAGYADKHWGRSYNRPWLHLSSCCLYSQRKERMLKHSAFVVDGCCPRFLFFHMKPQLMMQLTYTGEDFCYSFSQPLNLPRIRWCTKARKDHYTWQIGGRNLTSTIRASITIPKDKMLSLYYTDPSENLEGTTRRRKPVKAGGEGYGTIELYRITSAGREWIDTLTLSSVLCEYQRDSHSSPQ